MKIGEVWKWKRGERIGSPNRPPEFGSFNHHDKVRITSIEGDMVNYTDMRGELVMSYYNGLMRQSFLNLYERDYNEETKTLPIKKVGFLSEAPYNENW